MLQRIKAVLDFTKLNATAFADTIGIARPVMSHILTGRNNPSLEVVQKILKAFPELNPGWLVLGEGLMLKTVGAKPDHHEQEPEKMIEKKESASKITEEPNLEIIQEEVKGAIPNVPKAEDYSQPEKIIILFSDQTFQEYSKRK